MNLQKEKREPPRASHHHAGWIAWRTPLLLPVAGELFLLTLPFIERTTMKRAGPVLKVKDLQPRSAIFMLGGAPTAHEVLPDISNNAGSVKLFLSRLVPSLLRVVFLVFFDPVH
jgi:hypothetical protein